MSETAESGVTLRERKRLRTRAILIDAGRRLFEERGYDATTVADIAAAAEIGTRTFFAYFESKDQLLFPEADHRIDVAIAAIKTRSANQTPAQVLLSAIDEALTDDEMVSPIAQLRLRLIEEVPAVQARGVRLQLQAQRAIAAALIDAYPELDPVPANALVGAFIAASAAAIEARKSTLDRPTGSTAHKEQLRAAVAYALGQP